jgi:hypothetical protein
LEGDTAQGAKWQILIIIPYRHSEQLVEHFGLMM